MYAINYNYFIQDGTFQQAFNKSQNTKNTFKNKPYIVLPLLNDLL